MDGCASANTGWPSRTARPGFEVGHGGIADYFGIAVVLFDDQDHVAECRLTCGWGRLEDRCASGAAGEEQARTHRTRRTPKNGPGKHCAFTHDGIGRPFRSETLRMSKAGQMFTAKTAPVGAEPVRLWRLVRNPDLDLCGRQTLFVRGVYRSDLIEVLRVVGHA